MKKYIKIIIIMFIYIMLNKSVLAYDDSSNYTNIIFNSKTTKGYGNGDCILLENNYNGKKLYGMVDTGRDNNTIIDFMRKHNANELEFLILTHCHEDHFEATLDVINNIKIKKIYIKQFDKYFSSNDGNQIIYEKIIEKALAKDIEVIGVDYNNSINKIHSPSISKNYYDFILNNQEKKRLLESFNNINTIFEFGNAKISLYNWQIFDEDNLLWDGRKKRKTEKYENNNSLGVLIEANGQRTFLAGDINNLNPNGNLGDGTEERIAKDIGKVDLLKLGHHGYKDSNTENFINVLSPKNAIITNDINKAYDGTIALLNKKDINYYYTTEDENGIVATLSNNGVYINYESDGYKNINGKLFYIKKYDENNINSNFNNKILKNEYDEKYINIDSWEDLKNCIEGQNENIKIEENEIKSDKLNIILNNNLKANDTINIRKSQNIFITTVSKNIVIEKTNKLKDKAFFNIEGKLELSSENNSLILDGKNINSSKTTIYNFRRIITFKEC